MSRWYQALLDRNKLREAKEKKPNKYSATKITDYGRRFDSKLERDTYAHLLLLQRAGEIKDLECQLQVELTKARIVYKPDFRYTVIATNQIEYAEAKGFETDAWRIKRRLWLHYGPANLVVYNAGRRGEVFVKETLVPVNKPCFKCGA